MLAFLRVPVLSSLSLSTKVLPLSNSAANKCVSDWRKEKRSVISGAQRDGRTLYSVKNSRYLLCQDKVVTSTYQQVGEEVSTSTVVLEMFHLK